MYFKTVKHLLRGNLSLNTTKYLQYYKAQLQRTHRNNARLSRCVWTTYAKLLGKIYYIPGVHNTAHGPNAAREKFDIGTQVIY